MVGASLAGLQAAQTLRRAEFGGSITMVGDEPHLPYDRPPLSKQFLSGKWEIDKLRLRAAVDPDALAIDWRLGVRAVGLDQAAKSIALSDGSTVTYDGLIITTGTRARSLPSSDLAGVFTLRTLDDAVAEGGPRRQTESCRCHRRRVRWR
ncbi:MAG: FAD/NAD(P)-binding oxidoreductase [Acidimicrobiales bacterium]